MSDTIITCVYCGFAYPDGTPTHGAKVLTDHIGACEKHPMRELERKYARVRGALALFCGVDGEDRYEMEKMMAAVRRFPAPDSGALDAAQNALAALIETIPE